jgi:hypothetical protein
MSKKKEITISINEDGSIIFLAKEGTEVLLEMGESITRRASHVEPENSFLRVIFHFLRKKLGDKGIMASFTRLWPCLWRVNLFPVGGPILEKRWRNRKEAIEAEVNWLNENFL